MIVASQAPVVWPFVLAVIGVLALGIGYCFAAGAVD